MHRSKLPDHTPLRQPGSGITSITLRRDNSGGPRIHSAIVWKLGQRIEWDWARGCGGRRGLALTPLVLRGITDRGAITAAEAFHSEHCMDDYFRPRLKKPPATTDV